MLKVKPLVEKPKVRIKTGFGFNSHETGFREMTRQPLSDLAAALGDVSYIGTPWESSLFPVVGSVCKFIAEPQPFTVECVLQFNNPYLKRGLA